MYEVLTIVAVLSPLVSWLAYVLLRRRSSANPGIRALEERQRLQLLLAFVTTLVCIFAAARVTGTKLPADLVTLLLLAVLLLPGLPGLMWLLQYFRDGFEDGLR